jgi:hypothetical protein
LSESHPYHYAAWIVLDARLLVFVLMIALFMTTGLLAIVYRGRRWHDYVSVGVAVYIGILSLLVLVFNTVAKYPIFRVESFFQFP